MSADTTPIDWEKLASKYQDHMAHMIHHEDTQLHGNAFYAEALRRTFGFRPPHDHIKHETVSESTGLTTVAYSDHLREAHTIIDRMNREEAEKKVTEMRAEVRRVYREARADVANHIRERCNDRRVPSRFRREGVLLAADWVDPAVPKDRYGELIKDARECA